nr:hypothetical protein CFP56_47377 [Quercus suber]
MSSIPVSLPPHTISSFHITHFSFPFPFNPVTLPKPKTSKPHSWTLQSSPIPTPPPPQYSFSSARNYSVKNAKSTTATKGKKGKLGRGALPLMKKTPPSIRVPMAFLSSLPHLPYPFSLAKTLAHISNSGT